MKISPSLAACAGLALFVFLSGCATQKRPQKDGHIVADYTDDDSGVVLPGETTSFDRVLLDNPEGKPVTARYGSLVSGLYIEAAVRVLPAFDITPDQLLGQTVRSVEARPDFVQTDYRGQRYFGSIFAHSTQCMFDRSDSGDHVVFKVVVVPHGNYLICFTFLIHPEDEQRAQPYVDSFIQAVVDDSSKRKVLMTPAETRRDEEMNEEEDR
jgi:hypothetical protein